MTKFDKTSAIQVLTANLDVVQVHARTGQEIVQHVAPVGAWICNWVADKTQDGTIHYFLLSLDAGKTWETSKSYQEKISTQPHPEAKALKLRLGGNWFSVVVGPTIADFGRVGGEKKSAAKSAAAKANGKKGGRPKKGTVNHG